MTAAFLLPRNLFLLPIGSYYCYFVVKSDMMVIDSISLVQPFAIGFCLFFIDVMLEADIIPLQQWMSAIS